MAQLRTFFDSYATALTDANIERIANAFADHFIASGAGFRKSMANDEQFRAGLAQAANFYKQIGVDVVEVKNYLEAELGTGYWLTKVEWELLDEDLNTIITFDNSYLVEAISGKPQIVFFIAHNEQERMRAAGLLSDDQTNHR
jgi:Zn-dependent peptidase ImmA (M78 family)